MNYSMIIFSFVIFTFSSGASHHSPERIKNKLSEASKNTVPVTKVAGSLLIKNTCVKKSATVCFMNVQDGAVFKAGQEILLRFGTAAKIKVAPITTPVKKNVGHHHLLISSDKNPVKDVVAGRVVPTSPRHIHFGKGQQEAKIKLAAGKYVLTLQFADSIHRSYGKDFRTKVNVVVK